MQPGTCVAAIDCGTNSTRLLIVDENDQEVERLTRITRLGQDVVHTGVLLPEAIERTVAVLREFRKEMNRYAVDRARMVATAAVRDAKNGQEFLKRASKVAGVTAELLSGEEEGRLAYGGATRHLGPGREDSIVLDIGGGSTELTVAADGDMSVASLALGAVNVTERYFGDDPPSDIQLHQATATIRKELQRAIASVPALMWPRTARQLVGLAGSVATLACLVMALGHYTRERLHHFQLVRMDVESWFMRLAVESSKARAARRGMVPGREQVIVGGALILKEAMHLLEFESCVVSEEDILEGLAQSLGSGEMRP